MGTGRFISARYKLSWFELPTNWYLRSSKNLFTRPNEGISFDSWFGSGAIREALVIGKGLVVLQGTTSPELGEVVVTWLNYVPTA